MKNIFYTLVFSFLFSACEIVVDLDIPKYEPVLVLNSVLRSDSMFSAQLTHSVGSFEINQINDVTDATISVFQNEEFLGDMSVAFVGVSNDYYNYETGEYLEGDSLFKYVLNEVPVIEDTYTFKVSHEEYDDVQASTSLSKSIDFVSHEVTNLDDEYSEMYKLNFTFNDMPGEDYYRIRVLNKKLDVYDFEDVKPLSFETSDPSIIASSISDNGDPDEVGVFLDDALFDDHLFDGEEKTISLDFYDSDDETYSSFYLELSSISKDYFDYLHSYQRQSNYYGGELFAGEPVQVFTNVQNGLGIVGASNTKSVEFILPE
jgi:hypothetical protein